MKDRLFARPNLKMIACGALVIVAVQQLLGPGHDDNSVLLVGTMSARPLEDSELEALVHRALDQPTYDNYMLISDCYQKRGDNRKALHYLRKASLAAKFEH